MFSVSDNIVEKLNNLEKLNYVEIKNYVYCGICFFFVYIFIELCVYI